MYRSLFFLMLLILAGASADAKIAQWRIHPHYKTLRPADVDDAIVSDSAGVFSIWNFQGRRLATTTDHIMPLMGGVAASLSPDLVHITGIYSADGSFTSLRGKDYLVAFGFPYFIGKYLVVREGKEGYNYIEKKGRPLFKQNFYRLYPFNKGVSACMDYINRKKRIQPTCYYYDESLREVRLTLDGKPTFFEKTQFLSTVADDGRGIALYDNYFYYVNIEDRTLTPIFAIDTQSDRKEQVHINKDFEKAINYDELGEPESITAVGGNGQKVIFRFTRDGYPHSIDFGDHTVSFPRYPINTEARLTNLYRVQDETTGLIGISLDGDTVLPPQFTEVPIMFGDDAIVRIGDMYGQIHIDRDADFSIHINKDEDMAFLHQTLTVPVRVDMPSYIVPSDTRLLSTVGSHVDLATISAQHTRNGSFVQYDCSFNFPVGLSSDSIAEIPYPFQLVYEGLTSAPISAVAHAWHYKYYDVRVPPTEIEIKNGSVKFNFYIEREAGQKHYPFDVQVDTKGLAYTLDKISENSYQCRIDNLKEGDNSILVEVREQGCPPVSCPVDVTYKKPTKAQAGNTQKKNETVAIKVQKKSEAKPKPVKVIIPI